MAIPSRQIGWGTEDNLLWQISKQLERLTCVTAGGCGSITTTTTTSTVAPTTTTTTTLPVYRVFTALLTQSGGDNVEQISSGELTAGVTYLFAQSQAGDDFRNVGGPLVTYADEFLGTSFVATLTATPNNWVEAVLIYNTGAPVATVLENTIGNIWFTYAASGVYLIKSLGLFDPNKTFSFAASVNDASQGTLPLPVAIDPAQSTVDELPIKVWSTSEATGNGYLFNTAIEIRVYN